MRRQFLSVASPLDDNLEAGVGQVIQSAIAEDGVFEEAEPFLHRAVSSVTRVMIDLLFSLQWPEGGDL